MKKATNVKRRDTAMESSISRLLSRPCTSPDQLAASKLLPLSRNGIYDACKRGDIECFRAGKKIIIPTAPLRKKLGM